MQITPADILLWNEYEKVRSDRIKRITEIKKRRRIELGDRLGLLFENRDTVLHQIQEMVYLDKLTKTSDIEEEIKTYYTWLPCNGKVKATLYIYAKDEKDLENVFNTLPGIYNSVFLKVGRKLVQGEPENGRDQGHAFSTVQPLTFDLEGEKSTDIEVNVLHENYKVKVKVPEDLAKEIIEEAYTEC
ncbi:DUF3501 family protein [Acidianus sulfidivorans JP7]|uniref:DUF3501 domain-containing protein n=1 Tax=Acidianus sulfidivorans JP7 TaxID=619593 RepID=A0A2U9IJZ4_9CREN|nr:DUF3501 family protein [Acidianus sulfidivorans]AWR96305.1 DUF3501 family protein [Acidianus sulfidivorans JP7]